MGKRCLVIHPGEIVVEFLEPIEASQIHFEGARCVEPESARRDSGGAASGPAADGKGVTCDS